MTMHCAAKIKWNRHLNSTLLCLVVIFMNGCAALAPEPHKLINELIIRNNSNQVLQNVSLRIPEKNIVVSTNLILAFRDYVLGFPVREKERTLVTLSWTHNNTDYSRQIETDIPKNIDTTKPARIVVTISDGGQLNSSMEAQ